VAETLIGDEIRKQRRSGNGAAEARIQMEDWWLKR
jgi:hypothetical protein